nr:MAG TPA: hypothetical protein [Caudoviricetes sp.]DAK42984.1 MAG TPA: hypothetical protein [Caudoviricetes sp.]
MYCHGYLFHCSLSVFFKRSGRILECGRLFNLISFII